MRTVIYPCALGEGNGNLLQHSRLENPVDWGAWWTAVYGVTESDTTEATLHACMHWASLVAQLVKNPPAMRGTWVWSLGWENPLEKGRATHFSILAWRILWTVKSMGSQRVGHAWAKKKKRKNALEQEMATHSSVLAWRIPGTEEPGGLRSVGSHRVRHDWGDLAAAGAYALPSFNLIIRQALGLSQLRYIRKYLWPVILKLSRSLKTRKV